MKKHLLTIIVIVASVLPVSAQDAFDDVVSTIINNNTELEAQRISADAQRLDDADANALANPSVDFARVWGRHGIGNKLQLDVSQEFEWPGVYSARRHASDMARTAAGAAYDAAMLDLSDHIRQLLIELVYVRQQQTVISELMHNFGLLSEAIDKGVRGGELTVIDQRKMEIENFEIGNDMARVVSREQQIISELQGLTTAPVDVSNIVAYPLQPLFDRDSYLLQVATDPAVRAYIMTADYERQNATTASRSRMPGFSVGYQHQAEMGDRFNGFTVGVNLPVFQNRKSRQAALDRCEAAELSSQMAIAQHTALINSYYNDLELQKSRIDTYNRVFGDHKYLDLLLKAYNGGQISVIDYLSELHYYHQTMLQYLDSEYNYNLDITNLNRYKPN